MPKTETTGLTNSSVLPRSGARVLATFRPIKLGLKEGHENEWDSLLEFVCSRQGTLEKERASLNMAVVLDCSGSMEGEKLNKAKSRARQLIESASDRDSIAVVGFRDEAFIVANPDLSRSAAIKQVDRLSADGGTNLSEGIRLGLLELQTHQQGDQAGKLILLSDGRANVGETRQSVLGREAEVAGTLGFPIATIGIGDRFDEDLLEQISDRSGGRFYYADSKSFERFLSLEIQKTQAVAIAQPRILLDLPGSVRLVRTFGGPCRMRGGDELRLRPFQTDDSFVIGIRLYAEPVASIRYLTIKATLADGPAQIVEVMAELPFLNSMRYAVLTTDELVLAYVRAELAKETMEDPIEALDRGQFDRLSSMFSKRRSALRSMSGPMPMLMTGQYSTTVGPTETSHRITDEYSTRLVESLTTTERDQVLADFVEVARHRTPPEDFKKLIRMWRKLLRHSAHNAQNFNTTTFESDRAVFQFAISIAERIQRKQYTPEIDELLRRLEEFNTEASGSVLGMLTLKLQDIQTKK